MGVWVRSGVRVGIAEGMRTGGEVGKRGVFVGGGVSEEVAVGRVVGEAGMTIVWGGDGFWGRLQTRIEKAITISKTVEIKGRFLDILICHPHNNHAEHQYLGLYHNLDTLTSQYISTHKDT